MTADQVADRLVAAYMTDMLETLTRAWLDLLKTHPPDEADALVRAACDRNAAARNQAHNVHRAIGHYLRWNFPDSAAIHAEYQTDAA